MTQNGPVRLTLDQNLCACSAENYAFNSGSELPILPNRVVLEMKFLVSMPVAFKSLLAEFGLNPLRFSKYRYAAASLGLVPQPDTLEPKPLVETLVYA
jgi:hypothetical protein